MFDPNLDTPLLISEAAKAARELGVNVSDWKVYRLIRNGEIEASQTGGRKMTTLRAILIGLAPPSTAQLLQGGANMDASAQRGGGR